MNRRGFLASVAAGFVSLFGLKQKAVPTVLAIPKEEPKAGWLRTYRCEGNNVVIFDGKVITPKEFGEAMLYWNFGSEEEEGEGK